MNQLEEHQQVLMQIDEVLDTLGDVSALVAIDRIRVIMGNHRGKPVTDTVEVPRALLEEWHRVLNTGGWAVPSTQADEIRRQIEQLIPEETEGERAP